MSTMVPHAPEHNPDPRDCVSPVTTLGRDRVQQVVDYIREHRDSIGVRCVPGAISWGIEWLIAPLPEEREGLET